jgi:hypothetical protein
VVTRPRSRALLALHRWDEARQVLDAGLASAEEQGLPYETMVLLRLRVAWARASGRAGVPNDEGRAAAIARRLGRSEPGSEAGDGYRSQFGSPLPM